MTSPTLARTSASWTSLISATYKLGWIEAKPNIHKIYWRHVSCALCHRSFPNPTLTVRNVFFHVSSYVSRINQKMVLFKSVSGPLGGFWLSLGGEITKIEVQPCLVTIPKQNKKNHFPKNIGIAIIFHMPHWSPMWLFWLIFFLTVTMQEYLKRILQLLVSLWQFGDFTPKWGPKTTKTPAC